MRHLLDLLDGGTHGTPAEPTRAFTLVPQKSALDQRLTIVGTRGTHGTSEVEQVGKQDSIAQRLADLADAYQERIAICLEAGAIGEAEARRIAEAEIGAAFVRAFLPGEVAP